MNSVTYRATLSKFRGGPVKKITLYVPIHPRTPQVLSVEKRLAGNPLASGGLQNNVVSDKEDAKRKGKKTKKMIRMAGGQVE